MRRGARGRTRRAPVVVLSCLAIVSSIVVAATADAATTAVLPSLGPLLSARESPTWTVERDGGSSVPLPNGKALWVYGDTPSWVWFNNQWNLGGFITGSSAAEGPYAKGQAPNGMPEVNIGQPLLAGNWPTRFLPPTDMYLPDGSGQLCTRENGAIEAGRWPTGAALLPDMANVLITYADTCVATSGVFTVEGWGFMEYNWATNEISVAPTDVVAPATSGAAVPVQQVWGSPVVVGNEVTLYSSGCCESAANFFSTTVDANITALADPNSYVHEPIAGLHPGTMVSVSVQSYAPLRLNLIVSHTENMGQIIVYSASSPTGPWTETASGTLPACQTAPILLVQCGSIYAHPELSTSSQLVVSYYAPVYGPGFPDHPDPLQYHLALASVPLTTNPSSLTLESTGLPIAVVGQAYSATLAASGGTGPYAWSNPGGSLPAGLNLDPATGEISGVPTSVGTFRLSTQVSDSTNPSAVDNATLWIRSVPGTQKIAYTSTPPPDPPLGGFSYIVAARGGGSGNPVMFSIDASAVSVCSIEYNAVVTFIGAGHCVINANQGGQWGAYYAAKQVQQKFAVGLRPAKPTAVKAVPRSTTTATGALTVKYSASPGYAAKTYAATCKSSNGGVPKSAVHNGSNPVPIVVAGLTTAKTYSCVVKTTNAIGNSPSSAASKPVIVGAPAAATGVKAAKVAAGQLKVAFTHGASNGAPITSYAVSCTSSNGGATKGRTGSATPIVVVALTPGKSYTCRVKATNRRGAGPLSAASPAISA